MQKNSLEAYVFIIVIIFQAMLYDFIYLAKSQYYERNC